MWRIPSSILKGGSFSAIPAFDVDTSFALLDVAGVYTTKQFNIDYSPLFDLFVLCDQVGTVQLQTRAANAAPGNTWRNTDNPFALLANMVLRIAGYRVTNRQARWVITNTSGIALLVTEIVVINRSL
jgi:hypothetical protein